ncbi:MAG: response regulator [bacterium]
MEKEHIWTVLIATKDKSIQKLVKNTLNDLQSKAILVSSVNQFFEKLLKEDVDLIIFDPEIPALRGLEAFRIAKSYHPNVPSILIYEHEKYAVTRSVLDKGVIYRMLKPVSKQDLDQVCESVRSLKAIEMDHKIDVQD